MTKHTISPLEKTLNAWALVLIIWSVYRTKFMLPAWLDEFVIKPLVFITPVYIFFQKVEPKAFLEAIWLNTNNLKKNLILSVVLGLFFAATIAFSRYTQTGVMPRILGNLSTAGFATALAITFATAVSEEILSRGFVVKRLYESSQNFFSSVFLGSVLFLILHIPIIMTNYKLTGSYLLIFMATEFFLSLINSIVFLEQKSLIPPILIHAFYNIAILMYI